MPKGALDIGRYVAGRYRVKRRDKTGESRLGYVMSHEVVRVDSPFCIASWPIGKVHLNITYDNVECDQCPLTGRLSAPDCPRIELYSLMHDHIVQRSIAPSALTVYSLNRRRSMGMIPSLYLLQRVQCNLTRVERNTCHTITIIEQ